MKVYTYTYAHHNLKDVLDEALSSGEVRIRRRSGEEFRLVPVRREKSPMNVEGIKLEKPMTRQKIVSAIREGHERR